MNAFDDNGVVVGVVQPDIYGDELEPVDAGRSRSGRALFNLVDRLTAGADARVVGQRVLTLGYLLRTPSSPRTLRDLATRLDVPLSRAHRLKQNLCDYAGQFGGRRNKPD